MHAMVNGLTTFFGFLTIVLISLRWSNSLCFSRGLISLIIGSALTVIMVSLIGVFELGQIWRLFTVVCNLGIIILIWLSRKPRTE